jgi:hypothetical protein
MSSASLVPGAFYWAKSSKYFDGKITVVRVSTIFGADRDYWTLALVGTDQHAMPGEFEIIAEVQYAEESVHRQAAE